jgi:hypothetical protein
MLARRPLCLSVVVAALAAPAFTLAASSLRHAGPTDRAALIRALVRQDGTSAGVTGVYVSQARSKLAVVCQRTPDGGKVAYVFKRAGRSWTYVTDSHARSPRSAVEAGLEGAC